jgi:hypothetical protein
MTVSIVAGPDTSGPPNPEPVVQPPNTREGPPWWIGAAITGVGSVLLALYGYTVRSPSLLVLLLLIAIASYVVGGMLGFLFGIPKSLTDIGAKDTKGSEKGESSAETGLSYQPSTNLEQVSDWLTKILIGVGLVELRDLGAALASVGDRVSGALGQSVRGAGVTAEVVVVAFTVLGFLATYLWTRLYYGTLQALTDRDIIRGLTSQVSETAVAAEELRKATNALASGELARPVPTADLAKAAVDIVESDVIPDQWPPQVKEAVRSLLSAPSLYDSDPIPELFPKATSEANGRRLEAELVANLKTALVVRLRVRRIEGPPLQGQVTFMLHPTFRDRVYSVAPSGDSAETKVYTEGWFTAAAILDDGRTVLTYDLRKLPSAPKWFLDN